MRKYESNRFSTATLGFWMMNKKISKTRSIIEIQDNYENAGNHCVRTTEENIKAERILEGKFKLQCSRVGHPKFVYVRVTYSRRAVANVRSLSKEV